MKDLPLMTVFLATVPELFSVESVEEDVAHTESYVKVKRVLERKKVHNEEIFTTLLKKFSISRSDSGLESSDVLSIAFKLCNHEAEVTRVKQEKRGLISS